MTTTVRVHCYHPISNPNGPDPWNGKTFLVPEDVFDWTLSRWSEWFLKATGITCSARYDRDNSTIYALPKRNTPGVWSFVLRPATKQED